MIFQKEKDFRNCPRCGLRVVKILDTCPDCGLVFSRVNIATNKDAKAKKRRGDRDFILKVKKLPNDVSFKKLLLLSIFLGVFGAHNFYVGRYLKGWTLLGTFLYLILVFTLNSFSLISESLLAVLTTIGGLFLLQWFWDIYMIITKNYKVPVAIDIDPKMVEEREEVAVTINENNDGEEK